MPSSASKRSRKAIDRAKDDTEAILAAAAAGNLANRKDKGQKTGEAQLAQAGAESARTASLIAALMAAVVAFRRGTGWIEQVVRPEFTEEEVSDQRIAEEAAKEADREAAFIDKMRERLLRDIPEALQKPLPLAAVDAVFDREERYMAQHDDAVAARVQATLRRELVRELSPDGAYWIMSPNVKEHTPDCVAMAAVGWWPWSVLDVTHPPVHTGCRCDLLTRDEAIGMGYMGAALPDTTDAEARAQEIRARYNLTEAKVYDETDLMELQWNRRYPKGTIWGGRFMPKRGGFAPRVSLAEILRRLMGADAPNVVGRGNQRTITAPDLEDGMKSPAGKGPLAKMATAAAQYGGAPAAVERAQNRLTELAKQYGGEITPVVWGTKERDKEEPNLPSMGGEHRSEKGASLIFIGEWEQASIERVRDLRAAGQEPTPNELSAYYNALRTINHEMTHAVSSIRQAEYNDPTNRTAFALEEALTEEIAHMATIEQAALDGDYDLLRHVAANPDDSAVQGTYRPQRAALLRVLEIGQVPVEDRKELLERLSMSYTKTEDRIAELAKYVAKAEGISQTRAQDIVRGILQQLGSGRGRELEDVRLTSPGGPGAAVITPEIELPEMEWSKGDAVRVGGRTEPFSGKVIDVGYDEAGEIQIAVEAPIKDANGNVVDRSIRYPNMADVKKVGSARKKTLRGKKVTGRLREGDKVRIKAKNGDIQVGTLEKVVAVDNNGFSADVRMQSGQVKRWQDSAVTDIRRAKANTRSRKAPKTTTEKILGGEDRVTPKKVSGPLGYDPRRYSDPKRALIRKVQALQPGNELELADGSVVFRGDKGSALIERPDGSRKRYATPNRLANAESAGIEQRVGPRSMASPLDGNPKDRKSLARQLASDAALDEFKAMASPASYEGSRDDPEHLQRAAAIVQLWQENPDMALKNSTEDQKNALLWEVNNGTIGRNNTEEGFLWRGQAVQHDEPKGDRIRGWSDSFEIALEFARAGPEVRKRDGKSVRKTSVTGAVEKENLEPGDKVIITLYEITGGKGVEIDDLLERAEMKRWDAYEEKRAELGKEKQAEILRTWLTSPESYDVSLPDLNESEIAYLTERIGVELPPEGPERDEWMESAQSSAAVEPDSRANEIADALVKILQDEGIGAVEEILHDTNADLDGGYEVKERRFIAAELEAETFGDFLLSDPIENEYKNESEFIMDGSSLEGYRRIDVLLATGDEGPIPTKSGIQHKDSAERWLRAKVREALEDGGYKPDEEAAPDDQLTLEDDTLAASLDRNFVPGDPNEDLLYDSEGLMRPSAIIATVLGDYDLDDPDDASFDGLGDAAWNNYFSNVDRAVDDIKKASRSDIDKTLSKLQEIRDDAANKKLSALSDEDMNMKIAVQRAIDLLSESMDDYFGKPDTKDTETALSATGMASPAAVEPKRAYQGDLYAALGQHMAYRFDETTFGSAFRGTLEKDLPDIDDAASKLGWPQELIAAAKKMRQNALDRRMELVDKANRGFGKSMAQAVAAQPLQNFYESPEGAMASPVGPRLRSDEAMLSEVASGMSLDALKDGQGPVENFLRGALNGIGIDPYDIDMDKLTSHADDAEHAPISRLVVGGRGVSPCGLSRRVDFAVHVLLPELLAERYPRVAETLRRTSPRWGWRTGELPTGIGRPTERELQTERARAELGDAMQSPATYQPAQKHDELVDTALQAWVGSAKAKPEYQEALDALAWEIENNGESFDGQVLFRGQSRFLPAPSESGYRGWSADPGQGLHFGTHGYEDGSATITVYVTRKGKGLDVAKRVEAMDKEKSPMHPHTRGLALEEKEIILSPDSIDEQRIVIEVPVEERGKPGYRDRMIRRIQEEAGVMDDVLAADKARFEQAMASPNIFNLLKGNKGKEDDLGRSMLEAPPEPVEGIPEYTDVELQDIKGAGGSNDARIAEDPDGNKWLVKAYRGNSDRVATELLANAIYRDLGVTVSNAGIGVNRHPTYGDQIAVAYPLVDGEQRRWSEPNADLAEGFVADALLANWDVIGLTQDNILWNGDQPVRLDQGGTLEFRAQGERKSFGSVPTELWTMQSGRGQANGRMDITEAGMQAGAKDAALRLTPERIDELVDAAPFKDEAMRERIRTSLKERVAWLDRFARGEEGIPEPLQGDDEITDYFEQREFPSLPEEDTAMEAYLGDDRTAIDDHLRSGAPKEEATEEIADTIAALDEMFRSAMAKTDEDMTAWAILPEPLENPEDLEGEWMADKSYLPLQTDFTPTPGAVAVKVQIPAGSSVVMPAAEGLDAPDGTLLMGRNTKLQIQAVLQENGAVILQAVSVPR